MMSNELEKLKANAVEAAIKWARTGEHYSSMKDSLNKYMEASGANKACGNDEEAIKHGRCAVALEININAIHALNHQEEQRLHDELREIAEDYQPIRTQRFHR